MDMDVQLNAEGSSHDAARLVHPQPLMHMQAREARERTVLCALRAAGTEQQQRAAFGHGSAHRCGAGASLSPLIQRAHAGGGGWWAGPYVPWRLRRAHRRGGGGKVGDDGVRGPPTMHIVFGTHPS